MRRWLTVILLASALALKDFPDKDNDGIADSLDRDNDNDGILDEDDSDDYTPFADADGDGIHDNMDLDNDNDGIPDDMDDDDDNDGIPDDEDDDDNTPLGARLLDSDGDGIPDDEDEDDDNDGVPDDKDPDDNTPLGAPDQDGDGIADADDTDFIPPKTCPEGTPAQYDDPAHLMCPCGNFSPGQCKSGLFIPIWTNADIDAHLVKYIEFAFNPANAFRVNFTILENDNMKYLGGLEEYKFKDIHVCIAECQTNDKTSANQKAVCVEECGLYEAKLAAVKAEGFVFDKTLIKSGEKAARGFTYCLILIYFFMGVAIVSDRFMASIEVITSQEKTVKIKEADGETKEIKIKVWNETVSNLTLMALGSSAPEILLSVIETFGNGMKAGDLGPSTIVGSAAFNLFMIIAICIYVIPDGESRKIKHLRVFFITALWSILAYVWLYVIVVASSPGVVEPWEATITLIFFPLLTIWAWIADKRLLVYDFVYKKYQKKGKIIKEYEGVEMNGDYGLVTDGQNEKDNLLNILREIRREHPDAGPDELERMANDRMVRSEHKSRAFYRIQATRNMTGGGDVIKKGIEKVSDAKSHFDLSVAPSAVVSDGDLDPTITRIQFKPKDYRVMEGCGNAKLTVVRSGPELDRTCFVDYKTLDGSATASNDYEYTEGTLCFKPGETSLQVAVPIIDDEVFEEDEHFLMMLSNLRVCDNAGALQARGGIASKYEIGKAKTANVTILDDDHRGNFGFEESELKVEESCGHLEITVVRKSGARGSVFVPFRTVDGTCIAGDDFESIEGELMFDNEETEKTIQINIIDQEEYEKLKSFHIELGTPRVSPADKEFYNILENRSGLMTQEQIDVAMLGCPRINEEMKSLEITLSESMAFKIAVDKMVQKTNLSVLVSTGSWAEQFTEAWSVSAGDDDDEDDEAEPGLTDYIMHYLTLPWKLFFALIPPTDYCGGWICFVFSIAGVGLLTAFIGDFASHFGCTVGVTDAVTAISFVALGTSVPDTFASKVAAIGDDTADASIGNVTGSNAVNVFLGIGIAWTFAAFYWTGQGLEGLPVKEGTLTFSVIIFCVEACIAIIVLMFRRRYGGELGGPRKLKIASSLFFVFLWFFYLALSIAKAYCQI